MENLRFQRAKTPAPSCLENKLHVTLDSLLSTRYNIGRRYEMKLTKWELEFLIDLLEKEERRFISRKRSTRRIGELHAKLSNFLTLRLPKK